MFLQEQKTLERQIISYDTENWDELRFMNTKYIITIPTKVEF